MYYKKPIFSIQVFTIKIFLDKLCLIVKAINLSKKMFSTLLEYTAFFLWLYQKKYKLIKSFYFNYTILEKKTYH